MTTPSRLIITRADEVEKTLPTRQISAVLSIEHPGAAESGKNAAPRLNDTTQLILCFWDVEQQAEKGPDFAQIQAGIDFVMEHIAKGDVLIHCHAGKSRSAAIALGVLALLHPNDSEEKLIDRLLDIRPIAAPNILVVDMVDKIAGRNGKLLAAVEAHPQLTAQREQTEKNRQWMLRNDPVLYKKIFPEKFNP